MRKVVNFLSVGVALFIFFQALVFTLHGQDVKVPTLTSDQKLEIRNAQVDVFNAQAALERTPQWDQLQQSKGALTATIQKVLKDSGVDQNRYQLMGDLSFKDNTPKKLEEKKPEAKK